MDEPDSALDFLNKHKMLRKVRDTIHGEGRGGLVTLHDPNFAMAYCDRLFLLKNGCLAGELTMKTASVEEVKSKLSLIYGNVDILPCGRNFIMWRADTEF
jgi:iron complex transport system ATP-binding protein